MFNKLYAIIKKNLFQIILISVFLLIVLGLLIELPYTIYMPGGTSNASNSVQVVNEEANTGVYKTMYVLTVKANVITFLFSKIKSNWDVIKNKDISINDETYDEIFTRDKLYLKQSNSQAIIQAYEKAGINYTIVDNSLYVVGSECEIKIGEKINKVDDTIINTKEDLFNALMNKEVGEECIVETKKDGKTYKRNIKVKEYEGKKILGVYIIEIKDVKTENNIKININEDEAGSSGGLILALTIYDKITKADLSKGMKIVGTGTIEENGLVGKIDGLKYKMLGLKKEKYDVFFIPYDNLEEANEINKKYNLNMNFVPVKTFDEAIDYLNSVNN